MSSRGAHSEGPAPQIGGFVLAGGKSSRMGTDKAMLTLAGKPLVAYALATLSPFCGQLAILAGTPPGNLALAAFAPLVFDLHPGCGPIGGIEAALIVSEHPWNLILPVDVPLLPHGLLAWWLESILATPGSAVRIALFRTGDRIQPSVLLLHRDVLPSISRAIQDGEYKLLRVLDSAARELGSSEAPALRITPVPSSTGIEPPTSADEPFCRLSPPERAAESLWFANLNTPQEFAEMEQHLAAVPGLV